MWVEGVQSQYSVFGFMSFTDFPGGKGWLPFNLVPKGRFAETKEAGSCLQRMHNALGEAEGSQVRG